jgi:hypothetical protein
VRLEFQKISKCGREIVIPLKSLKEAAGRFPSSKTKSNCKT